MGLFINSSKHRDIFKNDSKLNEPNQNFFKRDNLSEMVKEQQRINDLFYHSFHGLEALYEQQASTQANQRKGISKRLSELKEMNLHHEKVESHVVERLKNLEDENGKMQVLMENERLSEQEFIDQINTLSQSNQEIVNQLERYGFTNEQISLKMDEQFDLQKQMENQISKQEDTQHDVLNRLNNQEALTEKIVRQLDNFRSIIFERSNYLAEKVEDGYQLTSSYITKLMTGSDQPSTHFIMTQKQRKDD